MLFLDTDVEGNQPQDRDLTNYLYGGNKDYRIAQEVVLGIGGVMMLHALGLSPEVYHLNEGHGAFAALELRKKYGEAGKERTVFTTHTPVPAGHDVFDYGMARNVLNGHFSEDLSQLAGEHMLNTTLLAMNMSRYINAVSRKHAQVTRAMFPGFTIDAISNGVHSTTWTAQPFQELYDKFLPGWRDDPTMLANAKAIPLDDILAAHQQAKGDLIGHINTTTHAQFDPDIFTIGFARRFATYKRGDLIFRDIERLKRISNGHIQLVYAGKAHPQDDLGKSIIKAIHDAIPLVNGKVKVVFLEDYSMRTGKLLTAGCDVWLNTPKRGEESSQTSGMKAAHNGVPHFSTHDGWWCEATGGGWTIGPTQGPVDDHEDVMDLYARLEQDILTLFKGDRHGFAQIMQEAIVNAGFFNTHRMIEEYKERAWRI